MVRLPIPQNQVTFTREALEARSKPGRDVTHEAIPHVLFDTQIYNAAGTQTLSFFNQTSTGDVSNMDVQGALPSDQYFDVHGMCCDALLPLSVTVALTANGALADITTLLNVARGLFTFIQNGKPTPAIPMHCLGRLGGAEGWIGGNSAPAAGAAAVIQQGLTPDNGGWPVYGSIRIRPAQKFGATLTFLPGIAVSQNIPLRISLVGMLYRPLA